MASAATDNLNPLGILGIDHLEFCTQSMQGPISKVFFQLGLIPSAYSKELKSYLFESLDVRFTLREASPEQKRPHLYHTLHGEGVSMISFRVKNAEAALEEAARRGAQVVGELTRFDTEEGPLFSGAIRGVGDLVNEFVQRPKSIFHPLYEPLPITKSPFQGKALRQPVARIDHLTNNVPKGAMKYWVNFYETIFGFKVTRYFDIRGTKTGLLSEVVQLSDGKVIIPINEPEEENGKSQIQEFLDVHKGPGVQHIALISGHLIDTVKEMRERGLQFLSIPSTYYELLPSRGIRYTEDIQELEKLQILVDGDQEGHLLQLFTENTIGPSFFEIIQRCNHRGFGEGNFKALFDSIERDQMKRGVL